MNSLSNDSFYLTCNICKIPFKFQINDGPTLISNHLESELHKLNLKDILCKQKCGLNSEESLETRNHQIFVDKHLIGDVKKRKLDLNTESNESKLARFDHVKSRDIDAIYGIASLNEELVELLNRNKELEEKSRKTQYINDGLKAQLDVIIQEKAELEKLLNGLARKKMSLIEEVKEIKEQCLKLKNELKKTKENSNNQLKDLENSFNVLKSTNENLAYQIDILKKKNSELSEKLGQSENLVKENLELRDKIKQLKIDNETLLNENFETSDLLIKLQNEKKELEINIIYLKRQLEELDITQNLLDNSNTSTKYIEIYNEFVDFTVFMRNEFNIIPSNLSKFELNSCLNEKHFKIRLELNLLKQYLVDKLNFKRRELAHTQRLCEQYKESIKDLDRNLSIITYDRDYCNKQLNDVRLKLKEKNEKNIPDLFVVALNNFSNDINKQTSHFISQVLHKT